MKKLLSIILSITILFSMTTVAFADETVTLTGAREVEGIIKVGVNAEFSPFEYAENGKLVGFDIDLMNYIAARIGYGVEFVDMPFDKLIPSVVSGEVDCAISAISVTEERDSVIDYSREYLMTNVITFENGQKSRKRGEYYAIVFRDGLSGSPYDEIENPTEDEKLYILVDKALRDLSQDRTVAKLIEKYELNKPLDEEAEFNIEYQDIRGGGDPGAELNGETSATSVPCSDWATDSIDMAKKLGIIDLGGNFNFPAPITREKFCELVYNLIILTNNEITAPITDSFTDTENDKIFMLNGLGIISGKSPTEFAPNDYLTREEAATIIIRMINKFFPMEATEMWFEYDDINEISKWASDSIQTISNMGIMNGVGDNRFAPKEKYTTEQAIATLVRVFEKAGAFGLLNVGIIGGADGPTSIIVGESIVEEAYSNNYASNK